VFNSAFSEARPRKTRHLASGDAKPSETELRIVKIVDDFHLFHAILFYLYTDRICFLANHKSSHLSSIPATSDAEGIYAIAHRLLLDKVTAKALHSLRSTCTVRNITARKFGKFASLHQAVGNVYHHYFMQNWEEVIRTDEFEEYFLELEDNPEECIRVNSTLRQMMRSRQVASSK
jgi:hypothetical protein